MLNKIEKVIDVHNHIFPDFYIKTMKEEFGLPDCGGAPWPKWSVEGLIKTMDKKGIEKAYMSYSMPGVYFKNDQWSRDFSRKCNEYMAEMTSRFPERLGGFASLPLPDVDGAVEEAYYALGDLKLNGIGLLSNVNGNYPGIEKYRPVFSELNEKGAVIFIHPNNPVSRMTAGLHNVFYGWFIETTRAALGIVKAGYDRDYPGIKYILAHAGGAYPAFAHLLGDLSESLLGDNFYVDTAKSVDQHNLNRLLSVVRHDHVVFGSDYPMANSAKIDYWFKKLKTYFSENELTAIFTEYIQPVL